MTMFGQESTVSETIEREIADATRAVVRACDCALVIAYASRVYQVSDARRRACDPLRQTGRCGRSQNSRAPADSIERVAAIIAEGFPLSDTSRTHTAVSGASRGLQGPKVPAAQGLSSGRRANTEEAGGCAMFLKRFLKPVR